MVELNEREKERREGLCGKMPRSFQELPGSAFVSNVLSGIIYVFSFFLTRLQLIFLNNFLLGCSGYLNFSVLFLGIPSRYYLTVTTSLSLWR